MINNEVFKGYLIKIMEQTDNDKQKIKKTIEATYDVFGEMSDEEAKEYYYNYKINDLTTLYSLDLQGARGEQKETLAIESGR